MRSAKQVRTYKLQKAFSQNMAILASRKGHEGDQEQIDGKRTRADTDRGSRF